MGFESTHAQCPGGGQRLVRQHRGLLAVTGLVSASAMSAMARPSRDSTGHAEDSMPVELALS